MLNDAPRAAPARRRARRRSRSARGSSRPGSQRGLDCARVRARAVERDAADGTRAPASVQLTRDVERRTLPIGDRQQGLSRRRCKEVTLFDVDARAAARHAALRRRLSDAQPDGRHAGRDHRSRQLHGRRSTTRCRNRRRPRRLQPADAGDARTRIRCWRSRRAADSAASFGCARQPSTSFSISKGSRWLPASRGRSKSSRSSTGADREALLASLAIASRAAPSHRSRFATPPSGWCSWYCFGPKVTAQQVLDNLDVIARDIPGLRYIQIDDGYQPAMGDWLETGNAFGGQVQTVLKQIRDRGFEPAIWVAPFIAEEGSNAFQGASRLVRQGRYRPAAACRSSDIRGLAPWSLVCARRHASRSAGASRARLQDDARRVGLHVLQARRQFLGRDSRRPLSRSARDAHRGVSARHGGGAARHPRRLHPRLQPSDLAIDRRDSRLAQLARHPARLEAHSATRRGRT